MSQDKSRLPSKRSAKKREAILEASTRVFLEKGYSATGMQQIASEADVSTATLYSHFSGKEELFDAVVAALWQRLRPIEREEFWAMAPEQGLRAFCLDVLEVLLSPTSIALFRVVLAEAPRFPELTQAFREHGDEAIVQKLATYLKHQTERGLLRVERPEEAAKQFLGIAKETVFWPRLLGQNPQPDAWEMDRAVSGAVALFLNTYGVK